MKRRTFLAGLAASPFTFLSRPVTAEIGGRYSVVLGPNDGHNLQLSIMHRREEDLRYYLRLDQSGFAAAASSVQTFRRDDSVWAVTHVSFADLPEYVPCTFLIENTAGFVLDVRPVRWLDRRIVRPRIAMVSCAAGYFYNPEIWQNLNQSNPDLVLFLGDNVYGDRPNMLTKRPANPRQLWQQYVAGRQEYDFYFRRELIPCLATWDDHDYGVDDGDRTYRYAKESLETFHIFWAQNPGLLNNLRGGPGVSCSLHAFGMDFVMLDGRSFRTGLGEFGEQPTIWGEAQRQWLDRQLKARTCPMWIANGQQFFGGYRRKYAVNYEFTLDYEWLVAAVRGRERSVGFLSGDVHFSEIMEIEADILGYPTVELTSSSMHSVTFPGQHNWHHNPRRRAATSRHNFLVMQLAVGEELLHGTVSCVGAQGELVFQHNIFLGRR
ncbi:MAG: hypothetical protein AB7N80_05335 [Bdellovibrionales bacterium]